MAFHVYAHDQGTVDFINSYDTRSEARAAIERMREEIEAHPSWWNLACPWFEISASAPHRETYQFPDTSGMG